MSEPTASCLACRATRGEIVPPGGALYDDGGWRLEHAIEPIPMVGWLVLKPLRHVERLADLTPEEASAIGPLLRSITQAMDETLAPAKVYAALFAEAVAHLHIHLIPRGPDMEEAYRGPGVFQLLSAAARSRTSQGDVAEALRVAQAIKAWLAAHA